MPFVPDAFEVPLRLETDRFVLEPLGPEHNERDHEAWMSSVDHIRATPGFADWPWPYPMSAEENLTDLEQHAADFAARTGFTYTVLEGTEVIGCVYIYPSPLPGGEARVRSWVTADRADLDVVVWRAISDWLEAEWPFRAVEYEPRDS
jgi:RimJ/RimL family protein N-acetyltransferase